ncbi:Chaperone protein dnaJ [Elasticomyces elasticus]|nr:Chaperone protein dnaJ [Elasticomyces elasticus]
MSAKSTGANGTPNGDSTKHRAHHDGSSGRAFTAEQKMAVIRVRKCGPTAFYDILGLEEVKTTCTDTEIKRSYRKLSLLTHPDKNGYEGADEAFKLVSRAFQVLSDPDKKFKFDKFGGDPDNRFGGGASAAASSPFSGFARSASGAGRGGGMWEEEISPEEMFRQFFGGGMGGAFGGGMFDTGPNFIFNLNGGGPGIRVHQFGGNRPRRRPHNHENANAPAPSLSSTLSSLLPLLIFFILPLLSSLFSGSTPASPGMRFDAAIPPHTLQHTSNRLHVPYWVNPQEVADFTSKKWRELDKEAESKYVQKLSIECENQQDLRRRMFQQAQGIFWNDEEKLEEARRMEMASCRRLNELGYRV